MRVYPVDHLTKGPLLCHHRPDLCEVGAIQVVTHLCLPFCPSGRGPRIREGTSRRLYLEGRRYPRARLFVTPHACADEPRADRPDHVSAAKTHAHLPSSRHPGRQRVAHSRADGAAKPRAASGCRVEVALTPPDRVKNSCITATWRPPPTLRCLLSQSPPTARSSGSRGSTSVGAGQLEVRARGPRPRQLPSPTIRWQDRTTMVHRPSLASTRRSRCSRRGRLARSRSGTRPCSGCPSCGGSRRGAGGRCRGRARACRRAVPRRGRRCTSPGTTPRRSRTCHGDRADSAPSSRPRGCGGVCGGGNVPGGASRSASRAPADEAAGAGEPGAIPGDVVGGVAAAEGKAIPPGRAAARRVLPLRLGREAKPQVAIRAGDGAEDVARIDPVEEAARARDVVPGDVFDRSASFLALGWIHPHPVSPERLRDRRGHHVEVANLDGAPPGLRAEQVRPARRPRDRHEMHLVFLFADPPAIAQPAHAGTHPSENRRERARRGERGPLAPPELDVTTPPVILRSTAAGRPGWPRSRRLPRACVWLAREARSNDPSRTGRR